MGETLERFAVLLKKEKNRRRIEKNALLRIGEKPTNNVESRELSR